MINNSILNIKLNSNTGSAVAEFSDRRLKRVANLLLLFTAVGTLSLAFNSCKKFVGIDPPRTDLITSTVFTNDKTANAAMLDIYYSMNLAGIASGASNSISLLGSFSSDELINYVTFDPSFQRFNDNALISTDAQVLSLWEDSYKFIYKANAVIEGLKGSSKVSDQLATQLEGEAKFIRAFFHFYLVNLWGDVPLVLSTNYKITAAVSRTSKNDVYQQIIADLIAAQSMLPEDYSRFGNERVRVNKGAATAFLARVYLYDQQWSNSEAQASSVISNTSLYNLVDLSGVFLANSEESIFQLQNDLQNTSDAISFTVSSTPPGFGAFRQTFIDGFEPGDQRAVDWVSSISDGVSTFYFPFKYKVLGPPPILEYSMLLRLAEQYLIRAEARARQNNLIGAQEDINVIRDRANLGPTPASDEASLLIAIEQERRSELFTEWGHRWLDLKRTNRVDAVLAPIKPEWLSTAALYPIPEIQILNDPNMSDDQNPGY